MDRLSKVTTLHWNLRWSPWIRFPVQKKPVRTLPERQENDALDGAELENRIERREQVLRGEVEQKQPVQRQTDADIVNASDVKIAAVRGPIPVPVVAKRLQEYNDERHERLDQAELQRRLLAESQKADGVGLARQAPRAVQAARSDGFASYLGHDVALAAQILVAQREKVVDDKGLVAVAHREEVHIVALVVEEEQGDPGVGSVDGHYEEYPDDPALLGRVGVPPQVLVDLLAADEEGCPDEGACDTCGGHGIMRLISFCNRLVEKKLFFRRHQTWLDLIIYAVIGPCTKSYSKSIFTNLLLHIF